MCGSVLRVWGLLGFGVCLRGRVGSGVLGLGGAGDMGVGAISHSLGCEGGGRILLEVEVA